MSATAHRPALADRKWGGPMCPFCGDVTAKKVRVSYADGSGATQHRGMICHLEDLRKRGHEEWFNCGLRIRYSPAQWSAGLGEGRDRWKHGEIVERCGTRTKRG